MRGNNHNIKKKKLFISHASEDYFLCKMESLFVDVLDDYYDVFLSSNPKKGIKTGQDLYDEINLQLKRCDIFVAIVTENYLRSTYCLYELSVVRFLNKMTQIMIYANDEIRNRIMDIANPDIIDINLNNFKKINDNIIRLKQCFDLSDNIDDSIRDFLMSVASVTSSKRPYVGMSALTYKNIIEFCQKENITRIGNGHIYKPEDMSAKFKGAKVVYIVSTTGAGLLKTLKEKALVDALRNGAIINVLIPDRNSQFCQDVAEAECVRDEFNPVIAEQNRYRIEAEFVASIQYLNEAYCSARNNFTNKIGSIYCYSTHTLLRQTILVVIFDDNSTWGWMNMNIAPLRTIDTPNIAISGFINQEGLAKTVVTHCKCLMKIAQKRKAKRKINGHTSADKLEHSDDENYWLEKKRKAEKYMKKRQGASKVLIEVAAQHPLISGIYPNEEFQRRLDVAVQLCYEIGPDNVWIYVPGSLHKYKGIEDKISLSEAGKHYLVEKGIDEEHVYAEEFNLKYKGEQGVYNSADESFVASRIFKDDDNFGRLICVCSPSQTIRKSFYYMEFGLFPECYGIPSNKMYHDPVSEYFGSLKFTVYEDHDWQDYHSEAAQNSRKDRKV